MKHYPRYSASLIILLMLGLTSCDNEQSCCTNFDTEVFIFYKNEFGENLINSSSEFDESQIRLYYKNGDEFELTSANNYEIYANEGDSILTIYPSLYYDGNYSTTLVELNPNVVDTLVCEFVLGNGATVINAWLNDVEMDNRYIEVEK